MSFRLFLLTNIVSFRRLLLDDVVSFSVVSTTAILSPFSRFYYQISGSFGLCYMPCPFSRFYSWWFTVRYTGTVFRTDKLGCIRTAHRKVPTFPEGKYVFLISVADTREIEYTLVPNIKGK